MLICQANDCTCVHHRLLDCLAKKENDKAKLILQKIPKFSNLTDTSGRTLLHYSAKYGNVSMTQHLVDKRLDINTKDNNGNTPLVMAVMMENVTTVDLLLYNNADIYLANGRGVNALQIAVYHRLNSPLLICLKQSWHLILKMLFEQVNKDFLRNENQMKELLLSANNSVKLAAVSYGSREVAKFILKNGYEINHLEQKLTALHWAMIFGKLENAKILIEHGASFIEPMEMFAYYYCKNFARVDEKSVILKIWLKSMATSLRKNASNLCEYPMKRVKHELAILLECGNKETTKAVLESEFDIIAMKFCFNQTFLHLLIQNENADVIDVLEEFDLKAIVNKEDEDGQTALEMAVLNGCLKKVEFIVRHGANVKLSGAYALRYAVMKAHKCKLEVCKKYEKIVELLLSHGADAQFIFNDEKSIIDSSDPNDEATKIILAHFALFSSYGKLTLKNYTRASIESDSVLKKHFDFCTHQVEEMKDREVYGTVTLFKLLTESEEKLVVYAHNPELTLEFNRAVEKISNLESYYSNTLERRMEKALNRVEWEKKAASVIEVLIGICSDRYRTIVYKIINYLSLQDLNNLCQFLGIIK